MPTHYDTLEVEPEASAEVILRAYRALAFQHHPDRNGGSAASTERFKQIAAAYEVLRDGTKRCDYDRTLRRSSNQPRPPPKPAPPQSAAAGPAGRPSGGAGGTHATAVVVEAGAHPSVPIPGG